MGGKKSESMSIQTQIYFCFGCQLGKSIIHAAKFVGRKGLSAEFPDGTPQMPHQPVNPLQRVLHHSLNPALGSVTDDFSLCPSLQIGAASSVLMDSHLRRAATRHKQPQSRSGGERGHIHWALPLFRHGAELHATARREQQQQDFSELAQPRGAFDVKHTQ